MKSGKGNLQGGEGNDCGAQPWATSTRIPAAAGAAASMTNRPASDYLLKGHTINYHPGSKDIKKFCTKFVAPLQPS